MSTVSRHILTIATTGTSANPENGGLRRKLCVTAAILFSAWNTTPRGRHSKGWASTGSRDDRNSLLPFGTPQPGRCASGPSGKVAEPRLAGGDQDRFVRAVR